MQGRGRRDRSNLVYSHRYRHYLRQVVLNEEHHILFWSDDDCASILECSSELIQEELRNLGPDGIFNWREIDKLSTGLYVWSGTLRYYQCCNTGEWDVDINGGIRSLRGEEIARLLMHERVFGPKIGNPEVGPLPFPNEAWEHHN